MKAIKTLIFSILLISIIYFSYQYGFFETSNKKRYNEEYNDDINNKLNQINEVKINEVKNYFDHLTIHPYININTKKLSIDDIKYDFRIERFYILLKLNIDVGVFLRYETDFFQQTAFEIYFSQYISKFELIINNTLEKGFCENPIFKELEEENVELLISSSFIDTNYYRYFDKEQQKVYNYNNSIPSRDIGGRRYDYAEQIEALLLGNENYKYHPFVEFKPSNDVGIYELENITIKDTSFYVSGLSENNPLLKKDKIMGHKLRIQRTLNSYYFVSGFKDKYNWNCEN